MDTPAVVKFSQLNDVITSLSKYEDLIGAAELSESLFHGEDRKKIYNTPVYVNAVLMVWVEKGRAQVSLDYISYDLKPNVFLTIMPVHLFKVVSISPDFKAKLLVVEKAFLRECNLLQMDLPTYNYMTVRERPCMLFSEDETLQLSRCFECLKSKMQLRSHVFYREVIQNSFSAFLLDLAHVLKGKTEEEIKPAFTNKERIVNEFIQLLFEHCKNEHAILFYADKLSITPQYLSFVLKDQTGKPANQWITEALLMEARINLRKPNHTIQQVADMLNFADQSSFGKFFKKAVGISPTQYRKSGN